VKRCWLSMRHAGHAIHSQPGADHRKRVDAHAAGAHGVKDGGVVIAARLKQVGVTRRGPILYNCASRRWRWPC